MWLAKIIWLIGLTRIIEAEFGSSSDSDMAQVNYIGMSADSYNKGDDSSAGHVKARAGTNISLACPGVTPTSFVYLVEWTCLGCRCTKCPNPNGEGKRLLRYNDKLIRWDEGDEQDDGWTRRQLDSKQLYALTFSPVTSDDTGTYLCIINNRLQPDSPVYLTVEDVPDAPPNRPMAIKLTSRTVELSWAPPRKIHLHPVTSYKIFIKEGEEGEWNRTAETPTNSTSFTIGELNPYTIYFFRISAKNELGFSKPSLESYPTMTHRELPSERPIFLREKISTSLNQLHLVWRPPPQGSLNGEFLGYQLTYRPANFRNANKTTININVKHLNIQKF